MNRLSDSEVPSNKSGVPSTTVNNMLEFRIFIKLGAEDSVGVAIMRSVGFFEFDLFFPFDFIIHSQDGLTASSEQLGSIVVEIKTIKLSVRVRSFVFHGTETLAGSEVPVLDLAFRVYCCEDVSGFEVGVFGSPGDVGKRGFLIVI